MKPATALLRQALLLLCGAASCGVFSCEANAQNSAPAAGCVDKPCWTLADVTNYQITNEQLRLAVASNSLPDHLDRIFKDTGINTPEYAAARKRLEAILQSAKEQPIEMVIPTPDMYVSMLSTRSSQTIEGKDFVLIGKDEFKTAVLTDDGAERLKVALTRAYSHIRNGDTSPAKQLLHHNDPATSRAAELRADLEGAGPLGVRNPVAGIAYVEEYLRQELHKLVFFKGNTVDDLDPTRLSDRDYKRISEEYERTSNNPFSPSPWDRITALRKEYRLMSEYEQAHAVRTRSDREAESAWLVDQISRDMQCRIRLDPKLDGQPCSQAPTAK